MDESEQPSGAEPKRRWFEPASAILMAVASLSTAWCSYQNSRWSGQTSDLDALADKREREAIAMHLESRDVANLHGRMVMELVDAKLEGDEKRARFYSDRFEGELKSAYEKWIVLKPFDDASTAPPHPFVRGLYTPRFEQEIRAAKTESAQAEDRSHFTSKVASGYLSNTVLFATVLFFAGTAGKFDQRHVRQSSLAFAMTIFLFAAVRIFMLPIA